jgi:putative sporulation protein YtaF
MPLNETRETKPMHGLLFTLLIALTNSIDSLGAWIAFSVKGIRISSLHNLWISLLIFAVSALSALLGGLLPGAVGAGACAWIGMGLFTAMGAWFIAEPLIRRRRKRRDGGIAGILENPEEADLDRSKVIDFKEATLLGAALSINNAGGCFSAGAIGLNPWLIGALSAAISFGALWVGRRVSALFVKYSLGDAASVVSGAILVLIGIFQVL